MAHHPCRHQQSQMQSHQHPHGLRRLHQPREQHRYHQIRQRPTRHRDRQTRPHVKRQHERQQVQPQRDHPQQRHARHVRRQEQRAALQQARRDRPQRHPRDHASPTARVPIPLRVLARRPCLFHARDPGRAPPSDPRPQGQPSPVAPTPCHFLLPERPPALHPNRIRHQGPKAPQVARRIQEVRVPPFRPMKPLLHQRARHRQRQRRQPSAHYQSSQPPQGRPFPGARRSLRQPHRKRRPGRQRQPHPGQPSSPRPQPRRHPMRQRIAPQHRRLEKDHGRVPHRRRPAQHGQSHPGHHRLHRKHQACAQPRRHGMEQLHLKFEAAWLRRGVPRSRISRQPVHPAPTPRRAAPVPPRQGPPPTRPARCSAPEGTG